MEGDVRFTLLDEDGVEKEVKVMQHYLQVLTLNIYFFWIVWGFITLFSYKISKLPPINSLPVIYILYSII